MTVGLCGEGPAGGGRDLTTQALPGLWAAPEADPALGTWAVGPVTTSPDPWRMVWFKGQGCTSCSGPWAEPWGQIALSGNS